MIPPSVHNAAPATTCRRPPCCLPRAAPGHDASQAQLARREVLVQRWNACHLLHAGGDGQRQCAHWTPGAIRGVVESTSHLSKCSSTLGHLSRAHLLSVVTSLIQGGGACHDLEECTRRCEEDGVPLCSSKNARDQIQMGGRASVWSPLPEENPAFHDWYKVSLFNFHAYAKFHLLFSLNPLIQQTI